MQRLNQPKSVHQDTYLFYSPNWTVVHEYNATGCHRLRCLSHGYRSDNIEFTSWYKYEDVITHMLPGMPEHRKQYFVAFTEYWSTQIPSGVYRMERGERLP